MRGPGVAIGDHQVIQCWLGTLFAGTETHTEYVPVTGYCYTTTGERVGQPGRP